MYENQCQCGRKLFQNIAMKQLDTKMIRSYEVAHGRRHLLHQGQNLRHVYQFTMNY